MPQLTTEAAFGRAFEAHFSTMENLHGLLREAVPAVARVSRSYRDVRELAPDLMISPERTDEFVDLWRAEFGNADFASIIEGGASPVSIPPANDETGHATRDQPESTADYRPPLLDFIVRYGSMGALQRLMRQYWSRSTHVTTIARSSIVFAVGALERAVAEIERARLTKHTGAASTGEKEFTLGDLMRLGDLDAVIEEAIEKRVESLCYGTIKDWQTWFARAFTLDIETMANDWPTIQEVVQRRHIIAHNSGQVSRLYIERTGRSDVAVGEYLPLEPAYVFRALDECTILGSRMISGAWDKLGDDPEHAAQHLTNRCYDALVSERWNLALALAAEVDRFAEAGSPRCLYAKVNSWLARIGRGEDVMSEVEAWNVGALAPLYRIARQCLLKEYEQACALIPSAMSSGDLDRGQLLSWPLFKGLREEAVFVELLTRIDSQPDADQP